jgi:hypothetical protein
MDVEMAGYYRPMRYNESTEELKQTIRMQKELIDAANKIVAMQQKRLDDFVAQVHRYLNIDDEEAAK